MPTYATKHRRSRSGSAESETSRNSLMRSCRPGLQFQRAPGNQALQRLLRSGSALTQSDRLMAANANPPLSIQRQLKTSTPGDAFEREADSVANRIVQMPEHQLQRRCASQSNCPVSTEQPDLTKQQLQTKSTNQNGLSADAPPIVHDVLQSSGQPLDRKTRDFMEPRFGYDFSSVRLHTDARAAKSAAAVEANAYTVGQHIALGEGQYSPQTPSGKQLLAHELTHVVHQTGGRQVAPTLQRQPAGGAKAATSCPASLDIPSSITLTGCTENPYTMDYLCKSLQRAYVQTRDGNCIPEKSRQKKMLDSYNGLKVRCTQDDGPCAKVDDPDKREMRIFKTMNQTPPCPGELAAAIFHETVHFTQSKLEFGHGDISWDCQESCFPGSDPPGRGTASGCSFERGHLPFVGVSGGLATTFKGHPPTSYFRVYAGFEKRRWIASYLDLSIGAAVSFIGETENGQPRDVSGSSKLVTLMTSLRLDPGELGGPYAAVQGGLGFAKSASSDYKFGKEVAVVGGVRWRRFDFSVNIGVDFDPTRKLGLDKLYTAAATLTIGPHTDR